MIVVGLTGSIGMGKTTTAGLFADEGAAVFDADAAVHNLYAPDGAGVAPLCQAFGEQIKNENGGVDRGALGALVREDEAAFAKLEVIVHPLVGEERRAFLERAARAGAEVAVLDIPLLFETGGEGGVDVVIVASAPAPVQRERVLSRPGMTADMFAAILARQTPDADKRAKADFIVATGEGLDHARAQVRQIMAVLRKRNKNDASA